MKRDKDSKRTLRATFAMSPKEYEEICNQFEKTTCRDLSSFIRFKALNKPLTVRYRNQSADEFLLVAIGLKKDLETVVRSLDKIMAGLPGAIGTSGLADAVKALESNNVSLHQKVDEIKLKMNQIYQLCMQTLPM